MPKRDLRLLATVISERKKSLKLDDEACKMKKKLTTPSLGKPECARYTSKC